MPCNLLAGVLWKSVVWHRTTPQTVSFYRYLGVYDTLRACHSSTDSTHVPDWLWSCAQPKHCLSDCMQIWYPAYRWFFCKVADSRVVELAVPIAYDAYWVAIICANPVSYELDKSNTVEHIRVNNRCYWTVGQVFECQKYVAATSISLRRRASEVNRPRVE